MWAQVCACTLCVCTCKCVCSLLRYVWGHGCVRMYPGGGVCIYMCFSVLVHECMCVHDMHSFLCVRVHACGYVLLMYTQLSALSMSHALCSGSPLS